MPPKKRTRAAQQPVKQEPEDGHDEGLERANETFPDGQPRGGATAGPTLRPRVRKAALSEGGKQSSSKDKKSTAKGKNAGTKGKKMASRGVTGKTTKKVGASTAGTYICRVLGPSPDPTLGTFPLRGGVWA